MDYDTIESEIYLPPSLRRKMRAAGCSEMVCTRLHSATPQKTAYNTISQETIYNLNINGHENGDLIGIIAIKNCFSMPVVIPYETFHADQSVGITALM
jgi:hypothetical protein